MHHSHEAMPLPPRYDHALAAGAAIGYGALGGFILTQLDPALRVSATARFSIALWCLQIAGTATICWLLRPHVAHLAYAMRVGRAVSTLPDAPDIDPRAGIAARRWMWGTCGTLGCCFWTLAGAIDLGAATGKLNLHHGNLSLATMLLCQLGAVCEVVRLVGPALAEVDDVYRAARAHARDEEGAVIHLHHHPVG